MNKNKLLMSILVAQVAIVSIIGFLQVGLSVSVLKMFSDLWTSAQIFFGIIFLEIFLIIGILYILKEQQIIRDEREQLIELRAYKSTYLTLSYIGAALLITDLYYPLITINIKSMQFIIWIVFLGSIFNFLFTWYYRKIL